MYSFAGLIRRTPPPTFSDTAITDRHSDTTILQLRVHWVRISWSIGSEKSFGHVPPVRVEPSTSCVNGEHPVHSARRSARLTLKKITAPVERKEFVPLGENAYLQESIPLWEGFVVPESKRNLQKVVLLVKCQKTG